MVAVRPPADNVVRRRPLAEVGVDGVDAGLRQAHPAELAVEAGIAGPPAVDGAEALPTVHEAVRLGLGDAVCAGPQADEFVDPLSPRGGGSRQWGQSTHADSGDRVRAYDFPGRSEVDYVEGEVVGVGYPHGVQDRWRLDVLVEREVVRGVRLPRTSRPFASPAAHGSGVVKIA